MVSSFCRIYIEYDNGCIYATRYSISHVFFWANDSRDHTCQTATTKLERKKRTLVFDSASYMEKVKRLRGNWEAIKKERLPVVVFTFGFAWVPSTPLRDTSVHAEVTPIAAVKRLADLSNGPDIIKNGSIYRDSVRHDDVNKSTDPLTL